MKVACTVLEGESGGNPTDLLGRRGQKGKKRWSRKVVQKGGPETRNAILHLIASNGNITSREIANTLNINRSAILKHLKKMQEDHIIRREGSQKSGKWVVIS